MTGLEETVTKMVTLCLRTSIFSLFFALFLFSPFVMEKEGNGMWGTHSLVKIHNTYALFGYRKFKCFQLSNMRPPCVHQLQQQQLHQQQQCQVESGSRGSQAILATTNLKPPMCQIRPSIRSLVQTLSFTAISWGPFHKS